MVFLAITPKGLEEALKLAKPNDDAVWCTSDTITEKEFNDMEGVNLTRFNYSFAADEADSVNGAIETIQEHHPGETVWVERSDEL